MGSQKVTDSSKFAAWSVETCNKVGKRCSDERISKFECSANPLDLSLNSD